jgi:hypothetical protein
MMMKLGRRPPKRAPAILYSRIRKKPLIPVHPRSRDNLTKFADWLMLGNDAWGDCVSAMCDNHVRTVSGNLTTERYAALAEVIRFYQTQNPQFDPNNYDEQYDQGMDIQTALEDWHKQPFFGCQLVAFAAVDPTNLTETNEAIAVFGGLLGGVFVQQANEDQYHAGKPWDYVPGQPNLGGHGVPFGGYNEDNPANDWQLVSWAKKFGSTDNYRRNQVEELWVAILPDNLTTKQFQQAISLDALVAEYAYITHGKVLPMPPSPVPPSPVPVPNGCDLVAKHLRLMQADPYLSQNKRFMLALDAALKVLRGK